MLTALGPTIQTGMDTLSSAGCVSQTIVAIILGFGPAFVATAVIFTKREYSVQQIDTEKKADGPGGVLLRFRRKLPHLEAGVPADLAEVSPHTDSKVVKANEKRRSRS